MRIKKTERNKNKINPKIKIKKLGWKNNAATSRLCPTRLLDGRKVHRCFINTIRSLSSSSSSAKTITICSLSFSSILFLIFSSSSIRSLPLLFSSPSSSTKTIYTLFFSSLSILSFFLSFFTLPAKTKQFYDLLLLYSFPPSFLFFFCQNNYNLFTTSFSSSSPFPFFLLLSLSLSLISEVGLIC